jgi:hypothetical protein
MNWLNLNAFHNLINLVLGVVGWLMVFDWTLLGMTPQQMGAVIGILSLIKLVANAVRDGLAGMVKVQPPVADKTQTVVIAADSDAAIKITKPKGT